MSEPHQNYKDLNVLTKWVKRFLYGSIAMSIIAIIVNIMEYQVLSAIAQGDCLLDDHMYAAAEANDLRQLVVALFYVPIAVISGVLILMWIYRANYNVRQLGATDIAFTPGWAIGWYFVPIANLWKPYQAMKEIWEASANPRDWYSELTAPIVVLWWFLWIVSNFISNVSLRMEFRASYIDDFINANLWAQASEVAYIPLCLVFLFVVNRIYDMQRAHVASPQVVDPAPQMGSTTLQ